MSPSKLGVFANLALAASAVLIPPTITAEDLGDDHAMEGLVIDPYKRSAVVECATCHHASRAGAYLDWEQNAGSAYQLDFEIGSGGDTVEVDSVQLFPPSLDAAATFHVTQVDSDNKEPLRLRVTGFTFSFTGAETVTQEGTELLPMTLQIASLEGVAVQPPALQINVLKDAHGNMMIASFDTAKPIELVPGAPEDCNKWPLLCKWRKIAAERIEQMKKKMGKGCHRRPHGFHNPMAEDTIEGKPPHRFHASGPPHRHPHHRPHHMGHHGHGQHHRMHMFARRAFFTILVPIIIGIFAGTVTYLIGMVLGTFIAIVIAKIRGQEYQRIVLEDDVEEAQPEVQSEKAEYAELPAYDAPPVYEKAPGKEVDESK